MRLTPQFADVVNAIAALQEPWTWWKLLGHRPGKVRSQRPWCGTALVDYSRMPSMTAGYVSQPRRARQTAGAPPAFGPIDVDLRFWWECDQLRILGVSPWPLRWTTPAWRSAASGTPATRLTPASAGASSR